ncbi:MAG: hypothetical protein KDI79_09160 [Anaerolineae bacterium]|nr:hypothetical protein [Anaerolineae bacterium]
MTFEPKRWQTEIWLEDQSEPVTIYGESLEALKQAVETWLLAHHPLNFSNNPTYYPVPERRKSYVYSDGTKAIRVFSIHVADQHKYLNEGWYVTEGVALFPKPTPLTGFDQAVASFVEADLMIEAGPDYKQLPHKTEGSCIKRIATHPTLLAAAVGIATAMCYLAMPIQGGIKKNFVLAMSNPLAVIFFILVMGILFIGLGYFVFKGISYVDSPRRKNTRSRIELRHH